MNMSPDKAKGNEGGESVGLEMGDDACGLRVITRVLLSGRGRQESRCLSDVM